MSQEPDPSDAPFVSSPMSRPWLGRVFILGGPLGLAVAITLGFWVSSARVRHTVNVQVEPVWEVAGTLAVRAQIAPEEPQRIEAAYGEVWVEQGERRWPLAELEATPGSGILQATFEVPALELGRADFHVRLGAETVDPREETVSVEVVADRPARAPEPVVQGSNLQHGDDTEPHPAGVRIDVLPGDRWLTGFENTLWVRVALEDGRPYRGPLEVWLASGEFMHVVASADAPERLREGETDALGLVRLRGMLTSDVARFEVRLVETGREGAAARSRRVRLVSYSGAVRVEAEREVARPSEATIEVRGFGFSGRRPVYVDAHGPDGAWIATVQPPFEGRQLPRPWSIAGLEPGLLQLEGYHFTNDPGESTAVRRLQVSAQPPEEPASLDPLIRAHRDAVDLARVDRHYDAKIERAYLDAIDALALEPDDVATARSYLLSTLPNAVFGPPAALMTRTRDLAAMAEHKRRWTLGLRVFLLGGGGLFLLAMLVAMVRAQAASAAATREELLRLGDDGPGRAELEAWMARGKRQALLRGAVVAAIMALALVLTTVMLENLL